MASQKKKTPARPVRKLRDLKSRRDPKGGKTDVNTPTIATPPKAPKTAWIEIDSFSFGASNNSP